MALTRITKGVIKPNENYDTHNIVSTGIVTSVGLDVNGNADISGSLSVGGVLTYEDVTSIDSVGIITARSGLVSPNADIDDFVSVGNNIHLGNAGVITATSFVGSGAALTGIDATAIKDSGGNVKVQAQASGAMYTGIHTFSSGAEVGSNIKLGNAGVITATTFVGNGDFVDLDVDGHTNLDNVSVAGVSTFSGNAIFNDKVGIGDDTPENKLKITVSSGNDGMVVQNTSTANIALIGARNGDATLQIGQFGSTASGNVFGIAAANLAFMYTTSYASTHPSALLIGNSSNKDIIFATNATARVRIHDTGQVTIGALASTTVASGILHTKVSNTTSPVVFENDTENADVVIRTTGTNKHSVLGFGDGGDNFAGNIDYDHQNNNMVFDTAGGERLRIGSGGIVTQKETGTGNGQGGIKASTANTGGNAGFGFITGGTQRFSVVTIGSAGNEALRVYDVNNSAERLRITSDGKIGINQNTPTAELEVVPTGTSTSSTIFIHAPTHNTNVASEAILKFGYGHSGSPDGVGHIKMVEEAGNSFDADFIFGLPTDNGSGGSTTNERLRITSDGVMQLGNSNLRTNITVPHSTQPQTTTPRFQVENVVQSYSNTGISAINNSSSGYSPSITVGVSWANSLNSNSRGGAGLNYQLGSFNFVGNDGTNFITGAAINAYLDGAIGTNDMPARLEFRTTPDGSATPVERLRITSDGNIQLSNSSVEITSNTSDGSDNKRVLIGGGGASGQNRGAQVVVHGNEYTDHQGRLQLLAGNSGNANGTIDLYANGSTRVRLKESGQLQLMNGSFSDNVDCIMGNGGNLTIGGQTKIIFRTATNNVANISSSGNLAIGDMNGADAQTGKLHLRSDSNGQNFIQYLQNRYQGGGSSTLIAMSIGSVDFSSNKYAYMGATISAVNENGTQLVFANNMHNTAAAERVRISSLGELTLKTHGETEASTGGETTALTMDRYGGVKLGGDARDSRGASPSMRGKPKGMRAPNVLDWGLDRGDSTYRAGQNITNFDGTYNVDYSINGSTGTNKWVIGEGPHGGHEWLWSGKSADANNSHGQGGWNTTGLRTDPAYTYMFVTYVKRVSSNATGNFYIGTGGVSALGSGTTSNINNAYWTCGSVSNLSRNVWHVGIHYVRSYYTTINQKLPNAGLYRMSDGSRIEDGSACNMNNGCKHPSATDGQNNITYRSYLYYATANDGTELHWAQSLCYKVDGTEPTVMELVGRELPNSDGTGHWDGT